MLRKACRVKAKIRPTYGLAGCEEVRLSASIAFTTNLEHESKQTISTGNDRH